MGYARWVSCKVGLTRSGSHARWVSREVDYARYESPSEMFHSLIFLNCNQSRGMKGIKLTVVNIISLVNELISEMDVLQAI